jgi:type I restriction enzyme S subunit
MSIEIELPEGWTKVKLGDLLTVSSGKGIKVNELQGGKYPVYGGNGINGYHDGYFLEEERLIIGRVGVKCGVMHITKSKSWVTDNALIINPKIDDFNIKFFKLKLEFENLNKLSVSTAQPVISGSKIYAYEVLIPPPAEQHQIVDKIEELFSELDKGIESLKTAQQQLKVYRQAVLKWAFEGKLTNENVKDGELPGWEWVNIDTVADVNPKIPDKEGISDLLEIQFLPMKLVEAITGQVHLTEIRKFGEVKKGYTPFINNDVIFAKVTPCMENGKIAVVNNLKNEIGFGSSEFHVIRSKGNIKSKYIFHFLIQERFRSEAANAMTGAVGLRRVPKQFIENYLIPLPKLQEQELIIQEIESRLSVCDKMEETITTSLQQAEALRQSILKRAFEGKLINKKTYATID